MKPQKFNKHTRTNNSISDFNFQWKYYNSNSGIDSLAYLRDIIGPVFNLNSLKGKVVADIGSGNGRFTHVLSDYAREVYSVEPSAEAIQNNRNFNREKKNILFINEPLENITLTETVDVVFCIGVLHHIADMNTALLTMRRCLRQGGKIVLWVYGREGNGLYLFLAKSLRLLTTRLPDTLLTRITRTMVPLVNLYSRSCRKFPYLPMRRYFANVIGRMSNYEIERNIFDQLNPKVSSYLTRPQIEAMLSHAGLTDAVFYHRHGYSWTVVSTKQV